MTKQKTKALERKILPQKWTMSYSLSKKIEQGFRPSPTGKWWVEDYSSEFSIWNKEDKQYIGTELAQDTHEQTVKRVLDGHTVKLLMEEQRN